MSEAGERLIRSLEEAIAWKQGKLTGARVTVFDAVDVARIRKKAGMTQKVFAQSFHIPLPTLRKWEQGQRVPQGPASVLLRVIEKNPKAVLEALL